MAGCPKSQHWADRDRRVPRVPWLANRELSWWASGSARDPVSVMWSNWIRHKMFKMSTFDLHTHTYRATYTHTPKICLPKYLSTKCQTESKGPYDFFKKNENLASFGRLPRHGDSGVFYQRVWDSFLPLPLHSPLLWSSPGLSQVHALKKCYRNGWRLNFSLLRRACSHQKGRLRSKPHEGEKQGFHYSHYSS